MEIEGSVCLITGASGGIGEALAHELTRAGAKVVLVARREAELHRVAEAVGLENAVTVTGDVTDTDTLRKAVDVALARFGKLDVLINNAGVGVVGRLDTIGGDLLELAWRTNVLAPILAYQAAVPVLRASGGGKVVNISSGTSLFGTPGLGGYGSTKAALNHLSMTMRNESKDDNITVLNIHPGFLANEFMANSQYADPALKTWAARAASASRTSEDAARDIVQAMREDAEEFRAEARR